MISLYRFAAMTSLGLAICFNTVRSAPAQSSTLTAFYTAHVVSMAPMWIAKETDLFKKHGIDVRLVYIGSGPIGTTSILAGEADIGIIAFELLNAGDFLAPDDGADHGLFALADDHQIFCSAEDCPNRHGRP